MALSTPIRIDADIYAAAKRVAVEMDRSAAQQVTHWARLGRELDQIRGEVFRQIAAVLSGESHYDELDDPRSQRIVRAIWLDQTKQWCEGLDLVAEFTAEGRPYAELDEHGEVVIREPVKPLTG